MSSGTKVALVALLVLVVVVIAKLVNSDIESSELDRGGDVASGDPNGEEAADAKGDNAQSTSGKSEEKGTKRNVATPSGGAPAGSNQRESSHLNPASSTGYGNSPQPSQADRNDRLRVGGTSIAGPGASERPEPPSSVNHRPRTPLFVEPLQPRTPLRNTGPALPNRSSTLPGTTSSASSSSTPPSEGVSGEGLGAIVTTLTEEKDVATSATLPVVEPSRSPQRTDLFSSSSGGESSGSSVVEKQYRAVTPEKPGSPESRPRVGVSGHSESPDAKAKDASSGANNSSGDYVIQPNDSWWKIAALHYGGKGHLYKVIQRANPDVKMHAGKRLKIPAQPKAEKPAAKTSSKSTNLRAAKRNPDVAAVAKGVSGKYRSYRVKADDTLWRVAAKLYKDPYRFKEIQKLNPSINPDRLRPGQVLRVPLK